ncbi:MAG TPA: DUF3788 family protein [Clostridiaceae bacterium]|nr:DUF3788 family protein [Clostridiaceae bacterium]
MKELWLSLIKYMESAYNAKPKLSYSACAAKPWWNVKFQKNGQSFGTLYPEKNAFSVIIIISYKLDSLMQSILPDLSPATAELYNKAGDYMKMGKWIMLQINDSTTLEDYKKINSKVTNKSKAILVTGIEAVVQDFSESIPSSASWSLFSCMRHAAQK